MSQNPSIQSAEPGIKILPLGGLGEIGMNCMVIEHQDEILIVDCGLLFSDLDFFGVEFVIPDFSYVLERKDKVKAILITHGHEDHIGALPFALKAGLDVPVYASNFTSLMIREKLKEHGWDTRIDLRTFKMGEKVDLGKFKFTPVSVNHSIVDAAALLIDTPYGKIVHTGDFKIDPTPFYGSELDKTQFQKAGDEGVLLLMSDSTNVERHEHSLSESIIYKKFDQLFSDAEGLTLISMFSSNVGRMGQLFELAKKHDKRIMLSGRSMETNVRTAMAAGYLKGADGQLITSDQFDRYPRNQVVVISTGSQGEHRSALVRIAHGEHSTIKLQPKDLVVMSSKFIPGNEKDIGRMINNLFKQGAEVLYEAVHDIHVSGHATKPELRKMIEWTKPKFFVPIHGEYRHLVHHSKLALETGMADKNVVLAVNGDVIEVTPHSCRIVEHIDEPRILIEGRDGQDISKLVLKDRRQLGEKGIVFSLLVRNAETRKIIAGPDIISKGLANEQQEAWLVDEAKKIVRKIVEDYESGIRERGPMVDLQESIRVGLRRFFNSNIGKKPTVVPIVLDV